MPDQRQDRTTATAAHASEPALVAQHAHGEELQNAVLHVGETFVIGVEIKGARGWIAVPGLSGIQPS